MFDVLHPLHELVEDRNTAFDERAPILGRLDALRCAVHETHA